jgi:hypothetical protein
VEAALSASRLVDLEGRRLPGGYDLDHFRVSLGILVVSRGVQIA